MNFVAVVNPVSGRGKALLLARCITDRLKAKGYNAPILETSVDADHFRRQCACIDEETRVICIGGDGTLHYFLNHCSRFHGVAFYGTGTANVLSIEFRIPRDPDAFVAMLETDERVWIRPGITQDNTHFLMMYSFGIDGHVLANTSQKWKNRIGKPAFGFSFFKALFQYRYPRCRVTLDGKETFSGSFVIVSRIKHYAGKFKVAPDADPESTRFQVIIFQGSGLWGTLVFAWSFFRGRRTKNTVTATAARVSLQADQPSCHQLDGDAHPAPVTELEVSQQPIPLIVPSRTL